MDQPITGLLFHGLWRFSLSLSEEMPLVIKMRRGSLDLSNKGAKVLVIM